MLILRALRFAGVGIFNTAIGLSVIWLLMWVGLNPWLANAGGYAVGLAVSYTLNRIWTFDAGAKPHRIGAYLLAFAASYTLNIAVLTLCYLSAGMNPYLAQLFASAAYTITFFILCQWVVFAKSGKRGAH